MEFEIISEAEYEALPDDPEEKFVALEAACRRSMNRMMSEDTSGNFDNMIRLQYMATVSAAAQELGIQDLDFPTFEHDIDYPRFANFSLQANGLVTRLRLRKTTENTVVSVRLAALNSRFMRFAGSSMKRTCRKSSGRQCCGSWMSPAPGFAETSQTAY